MRQNNVIFMGNEEGRVKLLAGCIHVEIEPALDVSSPALDNRQQLQPRACRMLLYLIQLCQFCYLIDFIVLTLSFTTSNSS